MKLTKSTPVLLGWLVLLAAISAAGCGAVPVVLPDGTPLNINAESSSPNGLFADTSATIPSQDCMALAVPSDEIHQAIVDNLNNFRAANGLQPLIYSQKLEVAADAHVRDLYDRSFFAHTNPDGQNPGQRALAAGFCHRYVGENIAAGQKNPGAAQIAWENSPSHRDNMLEPGYKYVGVGFYKDPNGRMYWAQEFAYHVP